VRGFSIKLKDKKKRNSKPHQEVEKKKKWKVIPFLA